MKLHQNNQLFRDAVRITAQRMRIAPEFIEKDYWVTYALYTIFSSEIGEETVFKGGTALSKCYQLIERFSEDIDLVVLRREGESNNQLTKKIKIISEVVDAVLPEVNALGLTRKMGMNRKTAHSYTKEFIGDYGQIRDVIVLEATWLGYFEPYTTRSIISYVGQMMLDNAQTEIARENGLLSFNVMALEPTRTMCEKIMSLVRFSYGENPMDDLKKKIRHIYDLHQLLKNEEFSVFFHSTNFPEMLLKVANDDVTSFKNNNKWLMHHPTEALVFNDLENVWRELKTTYNTDFRSLVFGELPAEEAVLETLKLIQARLKTIPWTVEIDS